MQVILMTIFEGFNVELNEFMILFLFLSPPLFGFEN